MIRRNGKKRVLSVAMATTLATSTVLAAWAIDATSASAKSYNTISVGIALSPPKTVFITPYVAQAQGFFAQEGLQANLISMPNGLSTELGTTAGSINFGLSSATDSVEAAAAKAPIHAIASYGAKLDTECVAAPGYNTAAKLRGQNVGTTGAGGFAATTLAACLAPLGLTLADVHPVVMTRSQFVGALATGAIKIASFHADDAYVVLHSIKGSTVIDKEFQTLPNWWYGGVSSLDSYTKTHPAVTEHFLAALILADQWINNPKNFNALVSLAVRVTGESKAAVTYGLKFNIAAKSFTTAVNPALVNWTAKESVKIGDITSLPTYSQIVNTSFLNAATKLVNNKG
jgi:NitT/TauT family transport system substrate-binding protein